MTLSPADEATVERYAADLTSGAVFARFAASERSRFGYEPPVTSRTWGQVVETLGKFAATGDRNAATARAILPKINLYGTDSQLWASVASALFEVAKDGYFDVIGATGPESGRRSAHQHVTRLYDAIVLGLLYAELQAATGKPVSLGWCFDALVERTPSLHVHVAFPRVAAHRAARTTVNA